MGAEWLWQDLRPFQILGDELPLVFRETCDTNIQGSILSSKLESSLFSTLRRVPEFGLTGTAPFLLVQSKRNIKTFPKARKKDSNMSSFVACSTIYYIGLGGAMGRICGVALGAWTILWAGLAPPWQAGDAGPLSNLQPQGLWSEALTNEQQPPPCNVYLPQNSTFAIHPARLFPEVSLTSNDYNNLP